MPMLRRLLAVAGCIEFGTDGLTVLLLDITEPRDAVARTVAARGYTARVLLDTDGRVTEAYRVQATPTVHLSGLDGMLLGKAIGPRPWVARGATAACARFRRRERPGRPVGELIWARAIGRGMQRDWWFVLGVIGPRSHVWPG